MAAKLDIVIGAVDKASGTLSKISGAGGKMGAAMRKGALIGGAAVVGLGALAIKFGSDFESAFNTIKVGTGATGEALEGLKEDFKAALAQTPADMKDVAQATADLNTRLGLTGKPLQDMTLQMIELSRITKTDVTTNIETVTRLFGDWAVATEDQEGSLDRLFKTSQATGIGVDKLSDLVVQFGAPLRGFGFTLDESTAILAKFEKEGVNTEAVMGGLKIGLGKVAAAGKDPAVELAKVSDAIQNAGSIGEANVAAIEMFGSRAGPDMAAAIREGRFAVDDFIAQMDAGGAGILETAEATRTWQEKLQILRNRVLVKLEPLLSGLVDKVGELADWISNKLLPALEEWWGKHGPAIVDTVREVAGYLRDFFAPALDTLIDLWDNLKGPIKAVGEFLMEHKEILIVAAAAILLLVAPWLAVVAAIAVVLAKWDEISAFFTGLGTDIEKFVDDAIRKVEEIPVIGEIFTDTVDTVKRVVELAFDIVKNRIETVMNAIREIINIVTALIRGDWGAAWEGVKALLGVIWGGIKTEIELVLGGIKDLIWIKLQTIAGIFVDIWDGIKGTVVGVLDGIKTDIDNKATEIYNAAKAVGEAIPKAIDAGIRGAAGWIKGAMNTVITYVERGINKVIGLINAVPDINVSTPFGKLNIGIPYIPPVSIPRLERGGTIERTGLAVVHKGETFYPASGGGDININGPITVVTQDPEDFLSQLRRYAAA